MIIVKKILYLITLLGLIAGGSWFWLHSLNPVQDVSSDIYIEDEEELVIGEIDGIIEKESKNTELKVKDKSDSEETKKKKTKSNKTTKETESKDEEVTIEVAKASETEEQKSEESTPVTTEVTYPNMLRIPSANIEVKTVVGGFTQKDVDTNDITYVEDWSNYMNCDLYFGHNTRSLASLPNTKLDDIITICKPDGTIAHYKVTLSKDGILEESNTERGELWLDGVHYNRGFIKARDTGNIIFAYSDDGYDNNNLVILTCYTQYDKNGRWVVFAERVDEESKQQKELYNSRKDFKQKYLEENLYSQKNHITYVDSNYSFEKSDLGVTVSYKENNKDVQKDILISDILKIPVYTITTDIAPEIDNNIIISDEKGKYKKYKIKSKSVGTRKLGKYDSETGILDTEIVGENNKTIFSFNKEAKGYEAVILIKLSNEKECVLKLLEV